MKSKTWMKFKKGDNDDCPYYSFFGATTYTLPKRSMIAGSIVFPFEILYSYEDGPEWSWITFDNGYEVYTFNYKNVINDNNFVEVEQTSYYDPTGKVSSESFSNWAPAGFVCPRELDLMKKIEKVNKMFK